jgi:hypothetical protein
MITRRKFGLLAATAATTVVTAEAVDAEGRQSQASDSCTANDFVVGKTQPDASNTGVFDGRALAVHNGDLIITTNGTSSRTCWSGG